MNNNTTVYIGMDVHKGSFTICSLPEVTIHGLKPLFTGNKPAVFGTLTVEQAEKGQESR